MAKDKKKEETLRQGILFAKAQILAFERYAKRRDLLQALLQDGAYYTIEQVDSLIAIFMKGPVR